MTNIHKCSIQHQVPSKYSLLSEIIKQLPKKTVRILKREGRKHPHIAQQTWVGLDGIITAHLLYRDGIPLYPFTPALHLFLGPLYPQPTSKNLFWQCPYPTVGFILRCKAVCVPPRLPSWASSDYNPVNAHLQKSPLLPHPGSQHCVIINSWPYPCFIWSCLDFVLSPVCFGLIMQLNYECHPIQSCRLI